MKHTAFATFPSVKYLLTICCGCWAKLLSMDIKWRHFRLSQARGRRWYSPFHKNCHHCLIGNDILHNGRSGEMVTQRVDPLFALLFTTRATICKKAVLALIWFIRIWIFVMIFFRWFCDLLCLFWCPHDIKWIKFSPTCPKFGRLDSKVTDSGFENGIQPADNHDYHFHSDRELLYYLLRMLRNLIYKIDKKN